MADMLQQIDQKVAAIYEVVVGGITSGPLVQRVEKLESACFSGSGAGLIVSSAAIAAVISSTNFVTGVSGWRINKSGDAEFQDVIVRGDITADSGFFSGTVYVGATNNRIIIDGVNKLLKSENYSAGVSGWQIDGLGNAEFQNVVVRGTLQSTVFSYNEVNAIGGRQFVVQAAGTLRSDVTTATSPTTFNVDIKDPDSGHVQLFAASDILRITDAGTTNFVTVSSVSDQTTFYRYVCTKNDGTNTTFRAGTGVLNYGTSGDGYILMDAQAATGPHISVATHAGSPWSTVTERVRIGNLNGWGAFVTDVFGFALGDFAGASYMYFDPATSNTRIVNGAGSVILDKGGIKLIQGGSSVNQIRWVNVSDETLSYVRQGSVKSGSILTSTLAAGESPLVDGVDSTLALTNVAVTQLSPTISSTFTLSLANSGTDRFSSLGGVSITSTEADTQKIFQYWRRNTNWGNLFMTGVRIGTGASDAIPAAGSLQLLNGVAVDEFSTDGTLAGDSDTALPTEKAVKTYVNTKSAFAAHKNGTDQTGIVTATATKVTATTELFDKNGDYDAANSRHTPLIAGYYLYTGTVRFESAVDQTIMIVMVYKNGAEIKRGAVRASGTANHQPMVSTIIEMNGSTDYVEFYVLQDSGSDKTITGTSTVTHIQGALLARS